MSIKKKVISVFVAVAMAGAAVVVGATAANAVPPGCTQTPGVPYKTSSGQIASYGTASCGSTGSRTFIVQVHRVDWFNPNVATKTNSGTKKSYSATASNCDVGSGTGAWKYYGQVLFSGDSSSYSGNTGNLVICG